MEGQRYLQPAPQTRPHLLRAARRSGPSRTSICMAHQDQHLKIRSENLLEMCMEADPAQWAAYQIAAKSHPEIRTVGEAMTMVDGIVRQAIQMSAGQSPNDKINRRGHRA